MLCLEISLPLHIIPFPCNAIYCLSIRSVDVEISFGRVTQWTVYFPPSNLHVGFHHGSEKVL